jgi:hypothetical protein
MKIPAAVWVFSLLKSDGLSLVKPQTINLASRQPNNLVRGPIELRASDPWSKIPNR